MFSRIHATYLTGEIFFVACCAWLFGLLACPWYIVLLSAAVSFFVFVFALAEDWMLHKTLYRIAENKEGEIEGILKDGGFLTHDCTDHHDGVH